MEVKTTIELGKVEFGIYINSNKFYELNNLIKIIKEYFKVWYIILLILAGAISFDSTKTSVDYANYDTGYFTYKAIE